MKTKSLLRLFKAVEIDINKPYEIVSNCEGYVKNIIKLTLPYGFIFSDKLYDYYSENERYKLIDLIKNEFSLSPEQLNSSFHKSWKKIREADIEQLVLEQIIHYFTTYGFEELGIYSKETVYIPNEVLEIPEIDIDNINITVIHGYTKKEIKEKLINLLNTGIALNEDTIKDVINVAENIEFTPYDINQIKNKEVKLILCDNLGLFPEEPTEFMRYVIYKVTGNTLLIKDKITIEMLKQKSNFGVAFLFNAYKKQYGFERLAEIFFRFKPLFLALKTEKEMKPIINKIRKLADRHHKPMKQDYLNNITPNLLKNNLHINKLQKELNSENVNTFRKIRLAYALKYRTLKDTDSIVYKIRNGGAWATDFTFTNKNIAQEALNIVTASIVEDINKNVKNKKIYIPEYIEYALPATEKQFTGYFPSGTSITIPNDMIFGIHWNNVKNYRVDLDLSLIDNSGKYGWDASYRDNKRNILFSGDITDAHGKNGATELFYIGKQQGQQEYVVFVNYYNFDDRVEVPFDIIVAKEKIKNKFNENYMVNPNNVISIVKTKINKEQKLLGLVTIKENKSTFYYSETAIGNGITSSSDKDYVIHSKKYFSKSLQNTITLNEILSATDAIRVTSKENCDIDLSPENLQKDTIINLLK
jgi:hypothetical protein